MNAEIIRRPNRLKAKVSSGGTGAVVAQELVAQAQQVVADLSARYPAQAELDLSKLCAAAAGLVGSPEQCSANIRRVRLEAREIMGQGETFGYMLLSRFGRLLYDFCAGLETVSASQRHVIQAHIDAMTLVLRHKVSGDGGAVGRELLLSLVKAKAKFAGA